jgi:hypothetical protein
LWLSFTALIIAIFKAAIFPWQRQGFSRNEIMELSTVRHRWHHFGNGASQTNFD